MITLLLTYRIPDAGKYSSASAIDYIFLILLMRWLTAASSFMNELERQFDRLKEEMQQSDIDARINGVISVC